ncbi:adhesin [Moraxella catarrhalis]|uniref:ACP-like domain-containing protein n=1 Tax=Moraxella catarrhalis TaxID=480 RepID=A0AB36DQL4_MORCA|nr:adhesin [Moraxella catarrhalis]OAV27101.1 hypothetical protein AO370_0442 [Moraxella catarrhalis]
MKALKIIAPVLALGLSFTAIANAKDTLSVRSAKQLTNKVRQVTYSCPTGDTVQVNYGFNDQGLPTYAEANLGGKTRFLPLNWTESGGEAMTFGDDKDWQIFGVYLQPDNDRHSGIHIYPDAEPSYRCDVVGTKRIKG